MSTSDNFLGFIGLLKWCLSKGKTSRQLLTLVDERWWGFNVEKSKTGYSMTVVGLTVKN